MPNLEMLSGNKDAKQAVTGKKTYTVGTLKYTFKGLCVLFAWLLWGDFAFAFFENIFGRFIPLYLKDLKATNTLISVVMGSIAGIVNLSFLPSISQWSDRYRSRWGRRIPFLAVGAPLTVCSLILIGFAPEIGSWMYRHLAHILPMQVAEASVVLTLLCICVVGFHFFNMILCNGFTWLVRDVVPQELMARFLSWFRIVSTLGAITFNWYVFPHVITHRKEVCVGAGAFYLVVFLIMCWNVKEGEYPAPPVAGVKESRLRSFIGYFQDCFSVPLYRNYLIALMLNALGACAGPFYLLFFRSNLGLNMDDLGKIFSLGATITAAAYIPVGWLCDKFSPMRVVIFAQFGMLMVSIGSFLFIQDKQSLTIITIIGSAISVGWGLGTAVLTMKLFPVEQFGQLSAGTNIVTCGIAILGNYLIGIFMDWSHSDYRMAYLWAIIGGTGIIPMLLAYRGWKKHGGPHNYKAPLLPER